MDICDRVLFSVILMGIWALVLRPDNLDAHHPDIIQPGPQNELSNISCKISGVAQGSTIGSITQINSWHGVEIKCLFVK